MKKTSSMFTTKHFLVFPGRVSVPSTNKAMVSPVVMCGCASWTVKKAER